MPYNIPLENRGDANLISNDVREIQRNRYACKDLSLAINTENTKYLALGHHRDISLNGQEVSG